MKRENIFWGVALILFGVLLFLQQQGVIANVFSFFWPLALMLMGSWLVLSVYWRPAPGSAEEFKVALGSASQVRYKFANGAAQVRIAGGAPAGQALVGLTGGGMDVKSRSEGDSLRVDVDAGPSFIPFVGPSGGVWQYQLTEEVPATVIVESGASTFEMDLSRVLAERIELRVGASSLQVTLPARGRSFLQIEGGAASFNLRVPDGVAARIVDVEGMTALHVDKDRFPELASGGYQSADYDNATNRTEIAVRAGVGSVTVK